MSKRKISSLVWIIIIFATEIAAVAASFFLPTPLKFLCLAYVGGITVGMGLRSEITRFNSINEDEDDRKEENE